MSDVDVQREPPPPVDYGWSHAMDQGSIAGALHGFNFHGEPEAYHVAERREKGLPVVIWYAIPAGLVEARLTANPEAMDATLTPWAEVAGTKFVSRSEHMSNPTIGLTVETPRLTVELQGEYTDDGSNPSYHFVQVVRVKVTENPVGAAEGPRSGGPG